MRSSSLVIDIEVGVLILLREFEMDEEDHLFADASYKCKIEEITNPLLSDGTPRVSSLSQAVLVPMLREHER